MGSWEALVAFCTTTWRLSPLPGPDELSLKHAEDHTCTIEAIQRLYVFTVFVILYTLYTDLQRLQLSGGPDHPCIHTTMLPKAQ